MKVTALFVTCWICLPLWMCGCASEVLKGQVETSQAREKVLQQQLEETRDFLVRQDEENKKLLRQQAILQREKDAIATQKEEKIVALQEENRSLIARGQQWRRQYEESAKNLSAQNVSLQKIPSVTIVPNSTLTGCELAFDDPAILPPRIENDMVIIELQDELLFQETGNESSSYILHAEGKTRLGHVLTVIDQRYPACRLRITGYQDETPGAAPGYDLNLSLRKAVSVTNCLTGLWGVPVNRLEIAGCGSAHPRLANLGQENRRRNRRIEISFPLF